MVMIMVTMMTFKLMMQRLFRFGGAASVAATASGAAVAAAADNDNDGTDDYDNHLWLLIITYNDEPWSKS